MRSAKKLLLILLTFLLVFTSTSPAVARVFQDTKNHWAKAYVDKLSNQGIISGYQDNTFRPENSMSKAEFYSVVNNLAGLKKTYTVTFTDVKPSDWYYGDISKAIKAGYIVPTTGSLHPEGEITREEVVRILGYMYNLKGNTNSLNHFSDKSKISPEAAPAIAKMIELKIIDGKGDGTFRPKGAMTRAEISKIIYLLVEKFDIPEEKVVIDSKIKFGSKNYYD